MKTRKLIKKNKKIAIINIFLFEILDFFIKIKYIYIVLFSILSIMKVKV